MQIFRARGITGTAAPPGPPVPQGPISDYAFDEVSGSFVDIVNGINFTLTGAWTYGFDTMETGGAGNSVYNGGTAHAVLAANQPAHNLTELTISFYYQRNSAGAKHVLFAVGDGTQAGDLSIEVLSNGRLRGYHVGQDSVLRFFEASGGVTSTSLAVGTSYRVELSLGASGTKLYLDGSELIAAAIPANTNGWDNTLQKFLGAFPGGLSPADGAFSRLRIWGRQLPPAEVSALAAATSITIGDPPETGDEPLAPSLAEWLPSDVADPSVTQYVSNQNRGNGSGSSPANAKEVQAALNGASRGNVLLAVCQTPGTIEFWNYPNGLDFPGTLSGTSFITLQARQGDGVVISAGEDFAAARTPNNGFWTQSGLSQADIDKHIWRSASTFSGGEQAMMGMWIEFDEPHQLMRYSSMANLRISYGQANSITNYAAAGVHKDTDGRVYIRMQKPHPVKYSRDNKWSSTTYYGNPEAISGGQMGMPVSQNPNDYSIYLWRVTTTNAAFDPGTTGHHIKVGAGINSFGHRFSFDGASFIQGDRGLHWAWQNAIRSSSSSSPKDDFYFNRTRFTDGSKTHAAVADWKFGGWLSGIRSAFFVATSATNFYFLDCTIGHYHDVIIGGRNGHSFRLRNCTFYNTFDDGFQTVYSFSRVELGYCFLYNSDWGGFGESGDDLDAAFPHQWFVHHNIIDCRREKCANWRAQTPPKDVHTPHSPDGNNAFKIYNNIVFYGPDRQEEFGIGFEHSPQGSGGGNNSASGAANTHQAFNNIVLLDFIEGTKRYDPVVTNPDARYSDGPSNRSDFLGNRQNRYSAAASNELQDYNLYWRPASMTVNGAFRNQRGAGQTVTVYSTLAAWFASAEFEHSKLSGALRPAYSPGWEANSTMTKPTLPSLDNWPNDRFNYRPSPTSAVTVASSGSLNGQNWWTTPPTWGATYFSWSAGGGSLAPSSWKGPLDPNGSTMPVGVLNP